MKIQLKDPAFCKQILAQTLVLLQFLLWQSPTEQEKVKLAFEKNKTATQSRFVNYAFSLTEDNEKWALEARLKVSKIVDRLPIDGRIFHKLLQLVTLQERNWVGFISLNVHFFWETIWLTLFATD